MPSPQENKISKMIALIRGNLLIKTPQYAVVDVNGIGYKVFISLSTFPRLPAGKEDVTIHTYTHVREDAIQLYGFLSPEERDFFVTLLTISGIGPKMGLNIMSGASLPELMEIVDRGDVKRLSMIPGVGKKTAGRMILELKEKLIPPYPALLKGGEGGFYSGKEGELDSKIPVYALSALVNLGYSRSQASEAINRVLKTSASPALSEAKKGASLEEVIREALKNLARNEIPLF